MIAKKTNNDFEPLDVHTFMAQKPAVREWIVEDLICQGTTLVLYAQAGTGKTLLAYDLCKHIALGQDWNDLTVKQGKVLFIQADEPQVDTASRFAQMGMDEVPPDQFCIHTDWRLHQIEQLKNWIAAEKPLFVVIDSLTSCNRGNAISEKSTKYAEVIYELRDIADEYKCSILLLHHETKNGSMRGSTAIGANVSEVWRLSQSGDLTQPLDSGCVRILGIEKSRSNCLAQYLVQLDPENYSWQLVRSVSESVGLTNPTQERLYTCLSLVPGSRQTSKRIAEYTGINRETARRNLDKLVSLGKVRKEEAVDETKGGRQRVAVYFVEPKSETQTEQGLEGSSDGSTLQDQEPPELV
jgi:DNA-binding MarR family transcriptional regulator